MIQGNFSKLHHPFTECTDPVFIYSIGQWSTAKKNLKSYIHFIQGLSKKKKERVLIKPEVCFSHCTTHGLYGKFNCFSLFTSLLNVFPLGFKPCHSPCPQNLTSACVAYKKDVKGGWLLEEIKKIGAGGRFRDETVRVNDWHHPQWHLARVSLLCILTSSTLEILIRFSPFCNVYLNISTLSSIFPVEPTQIGPSSLSLSSSKSWTRIIDLFSTPFIDVLFLKKSRFSWFLNEAIRHMWSHSRFVWQISLGVTYWDE